MTEKETTASAALEPFAKALEEASIGTPDTVSLWFHPSAMGLTVGDLRRARTAYDALSTHTAAGAGPVGEAVAAEGRTTHLTVDYMARELVAGALVVPLKDVLSVEQADALFSGIIRALAEVARPVEPGEVERLTRENNRLTDAAVDAEAALAESEQNAQGLASDLAGTQAELAETRERLEKVLRPLREDLANACSNETIVRRYQVQCVDAALAALTDDAQEAGR